MTEKPTAKQHTNEQAKQLRKLLRSLTLSALSVRSAGLHSDWIDIRGTNEGKLFTHQEKLVLSDLMKRLDLQMCWRGYATIPPRLIESAIEAARQMAESAGIVCD